MTPPTKPISVTVPVPSRVLRSLGVAAVATTIGLTALPTVAPAAAMTPTAGGTSAPVTVPVIEPGTRPHDVPLTLACANAVAPVEAMIHGMPSGAILSAAQVKVLNEVLRSAPEVCSPVEYRNWQYEDLLPWMRMPVGRHSTQPPPTGGTWPRPNATKITLAASAKTAKYDSYVEFTARVTTSRTAPTGTVSFVDTSNGSVLDAVALSGDKAVFKTASLVPGTRRVVAFYAGSTAFSSSRSSSVTVKVGAGPDATGYQIDPTHNGDQTRFDLNVAKLRRLWAVTPGTGGGSSSFTYPVIADRKVFVAGGTPDAIWALNAKTGRTDWFVTASCVGGLAYDGHQLFCVSFGGTLTDFDADNGTTLWSRQLPGQYAFSAAPSAYDGVVYISGAGEGGTVYAVSEANGVVLWAQQVMNGDISSPAVSGNGVFVAYACQQDYRFSFTGELLWHHSGPCEGGGGDTVSLEGREVYSIGTAGISSALLSQGTGTTEGTFVSSTTPAFGQGNMYLVNSGALVAADPSGSPDRWSQGTNTGSAPVADQSDVFVGQANYVVAYSGAGHQVWSAVTPSVSSVSGLALGDGRLVATGSAVTAFGD